MRGSCPAHPSPLGAPCAAVDPFDTVVRDVERLRSAPSISPRVGVYDPTTGLVRTVVGADSGSSETLPADEKAQGQAMFAKLADP